MLASCGQVFLEYCLDITRDTLHRSTVPANTTDKTAVLTSNWVHIKCSLKKRLLLIVFNHYTWLALLLSPCLCTPEDEVKNFQAPTQYFTSSSTFQVIFVKNYCPTVTKTRPWTIQSNLENDPTWKLALLWAWGWTRWLPGFSLSLTFSVILQDRRGCWGATLH